MDASLAIQAEYQASIPWLSLIVLLPAAGALILPFLPETKEEDSVLPRNLAISFLLADFLIT